MMKNDGIWSDEKEALYRAYLRKNNSGMNKKEKHAFDILKKQRLTKVGCLEVTEDHKKNMWRVDRIISGYSYLMKEINKRKTFVRKEK